MFASEIMTKTPNNHINQQPTERTTMKMNSQNQLMTKTKEQAKRKNVRNERTSSRIVDSNLFVGKQQGEYAQSVSLHLKFNRSI